MKVSKIELSFFIELVVHYYTGEMYNCNNIRPTINEK